MIFNMLDIKITPSGNLQSSSGDLLQAGTIESLSKVIEWRLKTAHAEWDLYNPNVVADLPSFVGRKNEQATGDMIKNSVEKALTYDGLIPGKDLVVDVIPISPEDILIKIEVNNLVGPDITDEVAKFYYRFNLTGGKILSLVGGMY
jgi:hypothetical protein